MTKKIKLYLKAKSKPKSISFREVQELAVYFGFIRDSQNSSHIQYKRKDNPYGFMNFQPRENDKKMAKIYQVRQLVKFIEENELIVEEDYGK